MGLLEDLKFQKAANERFAKEVQNCTTLQEFFDLCKATYSTEKTPLIGMAKDNLIKNIPKLILATGAKARK